MQLISQLSQFGLDSRESNSQVWGASWFEGVKRDLRAGYPDSAGLPKIPKVKEQ